MKRPENFRAVEAHWPGLRCVRADFEEKGRAEYRHKTLYITVEGTAEKLIEHGFAKQSAIDALPPCGVKGQLRRTPRGTFQVREWWFDSASYGEWQRDASAMAERIGITLDVIAPPKAPVEHEATRPDRHFGGLRVKWTSEGTVIRPDWESLRRMVATARQVGALS